MKLLEDRHVRSGIIFLVISFFWMYIFAMSIHYVLPANALPGLPLEHKLKVVTWFPQGWGFFSKNPREPAFKVISLSEGKLAPQWPNNLPSNWFGTRRVGRSQGIEAGLLSTKVPESAKRQCEKKPVECLAEIKDAVKLENPTPNPTLCGELGFVFQEPVPWAWSNNAEGLEMPSTVMKVNITCSIK